MTRCSHDNTWGTPQWYENGELKGQMQLYTEKDPMYQKEYDKYVAAGSPDPAVGKPGANRGLMTPGIFSVSVLLTGVLPVRCG